MTAHVPRCPGELVIPDDATDAEAEAIADEWWEAWSEFDEAQYQAEYGPD